jgi:hypothetical protein
VSADLTVAVRTYPGVTTDALGEFGPTLDPSVDHQSATATAVSAWTAVLDTLEAAVDEAEAGDLPPATLLHQAAALSSWTPPRVGGPIPDILVARARRINERQHAALTRLTAELGTLRRHRSALGSVRAATAAQRSSVYVDVTG